MKRRHRLVTAIVSVEEGPWDLQKWLTRMGTKTVPGTAFSIPAIVTGPDFYPHHWIAVTTINSRKAQKLINKIHSAQWNQYGRISIFFATQQPTNPYQANNINPDAVATELGLLTPPLNQNILPLVDVLKTFTEVFTRHAQNLNPVEAHPQT